MAKTPDKGAAAAGDLELLCGLLGLGRTLANHADDVAAAFSTATRFVGGLPDKLPNDVAPWPVADPAARNEDHASDRG